jgi:hypothetical protein
MNHTSKAVIRKSVSTFFPVAAVIALMIAYSFADAGAILQLTNP